MVNQRTQCHPLLVECWDSVVDGGPALNQQWFDVLCMLLDPCPAKDSINKDHVNSPQNVKSLSVLSPGIGSWN